MEILDTSNSKLPNCVPEEQRYYREEVMASPCLEEAEEKLDSLYCCIEDKLGESEADLI